MKIILLFTLFIWMAIAPVFALAEDGAMTDPILDIQEIDLGRNVRAWLVEDHSVPVISLSLSFEGGSRLDPVGKEGRASLAAATLNEGAGDLDSKAFLTEMENHGIRLSFYDSLDHVGAKLKTVTAYQDKAFSLLKLALTAPRFDEEAVERMRAETIAGLRYNLMNPSKQAMRVFFRTLFDGHAYGRVKNETEESLRAITRDDLHALVKEQFASDRLNITIAGAITPTEVKAYLEPIVAALPQSGGPYAAQKAELKAIGDVTYEMRKGPQSVIVFTTPSIDNHDPDWFAAQVLNYILGGGGFSSRLMDEIREKRGLTYGVGTSYWQSEGANLLLGRMATANENVEISIGLIRAEWQKLLEAAPTQKELDDAKTYLISSLPLQLGSTSSIASMMLGLKRDELGRDYLDKRKSGIESVTRADLSRVALRLLDPKLLTFVVLGDKAGEGAEQTNEN